MYESRIAAGHLTVTAGPGLAPALDVLAARNLSGHGFLRAAWYGEGASEALRTLVVADAQGTPLAAIPTVPFGPGIAGARRVAGLYWPLRSVLLAPECTVHELAEALTRKEARALGQVWRLGPARMDDPATLALTAAADAAGWHVLSRPAGTSWVIDLDAMRINGRSRNSVARKLRAGWRKLEALGTPHWRSVRGAQWDKSVLADLARIEADSWIAHATDGSGAKFLTAGRRGYWRRVLADPALAQRLSATILMLDARPVAFSFDLDDGPVRYAIAGTYATDLKHCNIGKQVNFRMLDECLASDLSCIDLGSGDNGYKAEMGAEAAYDLVDLLFVKSRTAARLLARVWGEALAPARSLAHG